jgi:hypothetical protein
MKEVLLLAIWASMALGGYRMGKPHGRPVLGAMLGFWLGLIGLGILAIVNWRRPRKAAPEQPAAPEEPSVPDIRVS